MNAPAVAADVTDEGAVAAAVEAAVPQITAMLIRDIGKPRKAASFEVNRSAAFLRACAAQVLNLSGETVPVGGGRLLLGTWQGIYLWEHRTHPHTRRIALHYIGE